MKLIKYAGAMPATSNVDLLQINSIMLLTSNKA